MDESVDLNARTGNGRLRLPRVTLFAMVAVVSIACPAVIAKYNYDRHAEKSVRMARAQQAEVDARDLPVLVHGLEGALARRFCLANEALYDPTEAFRDPMAMRGVKLGSHFFSARGPLPVVHDKNVEFAESQNEQARAQEWRDFRDYLTTPAASRDAEELGIPARLLAGAASRLRTVEFDFRCGSGGGTIVSSWKTVGE